MSVGRKSHRDKYLDLESGSVRSQVIAGSFPTNLSLPGKTEVDQMLDVVTHASGG